MSEPSEDPSEGHEAATSQRPWQKPVFHTVPEAAELLRVDPVTIYRAIRANAFPAVKVRGRYVVPTRALEKLGDEAVTSLSCIDVANYVLHRRGD